MLHKRTFYFACKAFLLLLTFKSLSADTVTLRDGTTIANVKTEIQALFVLVDAEDGSRREIPKHEIRSVKMALVSWGERKEEVSRVEEASVQGDTWIPRPEEDRISPLGNFFVGLIPGMSGLYRTENYAGGTVFSLLSVAAVAEGYATNVRRRTDARSGAQLRAYALAAYGVVTLTNGIGSALSASRWNEGTWSGQKSNPPTTALGRGLRSAILPGGASCTPTRIGKVHPS